MEWGQNWGQGDQVGGCYSVQLRDGKTGERGENCSLEQEGGIGTGELQSFRMRSEGGRDKTYQRSECGM